MNLEEALNKILKKRVQDIMKSEIVACKPDAPAIDAARKMAESGSSYCLVIEGDEVLGIVTERDIVNRIVSMNRDPYETKVRDIMTTPLIAINEESNIEDAALIMSKNRIRKLAIVNENGKLTGMITISDIARELASMLKLENMLINALAVDKEVAPRGIYG